MERYLHLFTSSLASQAMQNLQTPQPSPESLRAKFEETIKITEEDYDEFDDYDSYVRAQEEKNRAFEAERALLPQKSKQMVKNFLQQVDQNLFSVFSWPPDDDCPAYKYHYIDLSEKDIAMCERYSGMAMQYLDQVRNSWGYDVDVTPPGWMRERSLRPVSDWALSERVTRGAYFVIDKISAEAETMGKQLELVEIKHAVTARRLFYLLTLTIKDVGANAEITVRATVSMILGSDPELEELKLIPSPSSPA